MYTPENAVTEFIAAYKKWNDSVFKHSENLRIAFATESYRVLINNFCTNNVKPQLVAFGCDSSHSLAKEKISNSSESGDRAIVTTSITDIFGFAVIHEYHLKRIDQKWKLSSLLYVDEDGKHECL